MKINRYDCDSCGKPIENGREYKVTVKFPIAKEVLVPDRWDRKKRPTRSVDLCEKCFWSELGKLYEEGED